MGCTHEAVERFNCDATLDNLQSIMAIGRSAQILEESRCHFCFHEGQEAGPRELQASQPHLDPWEGDGAANPGNHSRHMKDEKIIRSSQHGLTKWEVMFDQLHKLLR